MKLCEQDPFFNKKVSLLYKFVLTHRYENTSETKMRYNKILDNTTEQPNWIYDINNPQMKPFKQLKEVGEKSRLQITKLFTDYNFEIAKAKKIDKLVEIFEGDGKGSQKEPIEIV